MDRSHREQKIEKRLKQMPESYRCTYKRAVSGKSLRAAVNAQCQMCCCYQRIEVTKCTDIACPLWIQRPYQ